MRGVLPQSFYKRPSTVLAQELIGCEITHETSEGSVGGIIVETEAYHQSDPASHSYVGKTPRNATMFGPAGRLYVYLSYGIHYCINVVVGENDTAEAVLLRAIQPTRGTSLMMSRRKTDSLINLASGPGKLAQALAINRSHDGIDLTGSNVFITQASRGYKVVFSPRIGITKAAEKPWRFYAAENPFVTKHRFNNISGPVNA